MNKNSLAKLMALAAFAMIAIPAFAKADAPVPTVSIMGASDVYMTNAHVGVMFNSNATSVDYGNLPTLAVQYTDTVTGEVFTSGTSHEYATSKTEDFDLENLNPGTKYSYRAILTYASGTITTEPATFTTKGTGPSVPAVSSTTTSTSTSSSTSSSSSQPVTSSSVVAKASSILGVSKVEANITDKVATGGVTHSNGIVLYISDEHARVYQDDSVTFTVMAQNTHSYAINDARVVVSLPEQYEFSSSSTDANYDSQENTVTYEFGRIAPEATESFSFKANAIGEGNGTVSTTAVMQYDAGKISATDHDAYQSGSKSVLGASVFGAGFFPQTFFGWFIILLLIAVIVIAARRYVKAPKPNPHPVS